MARFDMSCGACHDLGFRCDDHAAPVTVCEVDGCGRAATFTVAGHAVCKAHKRAALRAATHELYEREEVAA